MEMYVAIEIWLLLYQIVKALKKNQKTKTDVLMLFRNLASADIKTLNSSLKWYLKGMSAFFYCVTQTSQVSAQLLSSVSTIRHGWPTLTLFASLHVSVCSYLRHVKLIFVLHLKYCSLDMLSSPIPFHVAVYLYY